MGVLLAGLLLLCCANLSHAQGVPIIPADSSYYKPLPKQLKDVYFYVQAGVALPMGAFGQQPDPSATVLDPFRGRTGTGAAMGYSFEMGYRRAFTTAPTKASRIYPFWGVAVGGSYNALDWSGLGGYWGEQPQVEIAQATGLVHLGGALKHKAMWVLEGYGGLVLPFFTFYPDNNIQNATGRPTDFSVRAMDDLATWAPGFSGGLTWRTRRFRIGAEFYRHLSSVPITYWEINPGYTKTYEGFFDWQTLRAYLGVQF